MDNSAVLATLQRFRDEANIDHNEYFCPHWRFDSDVFDRRNVKLLRYTINLRLGKLVHKGSHSHVSGVYSVETHADYHTTHDCTVWYIGSTNDIYKRFHRHHKAEQFCYLSLIYDLQVRLLHCIGCDREDLYALEGVLISKVKPILNDKDDSQQIEKIKRIMLDNLKTELNPTKQRRLTHA